MIDVKFFLGSAASLAIFLVLAVYFIRNYRDDKEKNVTLHIFLSGLVSLVISVLSLLWGLNILSYVQKDFTFIYSTLMLVQGFFLFMIIYYISEQNKKLFYLLSLYFAVFVSLFFIHVSLSTISILVYFFFVALISLSLLFRNDDYRNLGLFGVIYAGASIILHIFVLIGLGDVYTFSIFYNVMLFTFLMLLGYYIKLNPLPFQKKQVNEKNSYLFVFLRNFIFTLAIINFVFIGTVVIHEFGHLIVSYLYNCVSREIIYSAGFPETQILCSNIGNNFWVSLGGPTLPIVLGAVLILIGGKFMKEIGMLMIGFNLIISSQDFLNLGLSDNLTIFLIIIGVITAISGIILLAKSKTEEYVYLR